MQTWINFLNIFFWLSVFNFLVNSNNILTFVLCAEVVWVILYCLCAVMSSHNDDLNLVSNTFFILTFAGLEFSFGFILLMYFKEVNSSISVVELGSKGKESDMDKSGIKKY